MLRDGYFLSKLLLALAGMLVGPGGAPPGMIDGRDDDAGDTPSPSLMRPRVNDAVGDGLGAAGDELEPISARARHASSCTC